MHEVVDIPSVVSLAGAFIKVEDGRTTSHGLWDLAFLKGNRALQLWVCITWLQLRVELVRLQVSALILNQSLKLCLDG